jgi:hypothetical protein
MADNTSQNTRSSIDYAFHLPPPADGGGTTETLAVSQQMLEHYANSIRERERKIVKIEGIKAEWKAAVVKQVGEANWKKFIDYSRAQRMSNYGLKEISHDSDGLAQLSLSKHKAREASLSLLKEVNVEPGDLKSIHRKFSKEIDSLLVSEEPRIKLEVVPESEVPSGIREGKTNPWTRYVPPYHGSSWYYAWSRGGGFNPDLVNYVNATSGSVGHRSGYSNPDADDWDGLWLDFRTSVGVWYWPPHGGHVVMYIKARCANAGYSVWLDDEMGWSDSRTMMHSYITANVSPSPIDAGTSQIWSFNVSGNPDSTTYSGNAIAPNTVRWFFLRTPDPIPDGAWSVIWVGTRDTHMSQLNDVSTAAVMRNWWYFEELWLEVL